MQMLVPAEGIYVALRGKLIDYTAPVLRVMVQGFGKEGVCFSFWGIFSFRPGWNKLRIQSTV